MLLHPLALSWWRSRLKEAGSKRSRSPSSWQTPRRRHEWNNGAAVGRTKQGVPTWGREANTFVQYAEAALTWEKRYTAGPRLVQELSGAARRLVAGQPPGWVAHRGGVATLIEHLRRRLGKPKVTEVTDLLASYFKGTRRKPHESMNDYITRKTEAYMRASQALRRVQPHYERQQHTFGGYDSASRRTSMDSQYRTWSRQWTPATEKAPTEATETTGNGETEATTQASTQAAEEGTRSQWYDWNTPTG